MNTDDELAIQVPVPAIVVVQTCNKGHETAYAVEGVSFDDATMGTKVLDKRPCLWPGCSETDFKSATIFMSEVRQFLDDAWEAQQ